MKGMVSVMERSPEAFRTLGEEEIRQHFLVQLNGQYEGGATGETFNMAGKTDILIRDGDRNVFIAECKLWDGPASLIGALEQLLSYATWRDSKTAILVFNRNKNFSDVIAKISPTIESHPNHVRTTVYPDGLGFRYVFRSMTDPNRELLVTVLPFDVPRCAADNPALRYCVRRLPRSRKTPTGRVFCRRLMRWRKRSGPVGSRRNFRNLWTPRRNGTALSVLCFPH